MQTLRSILLLLCLMFGGVECQAQDVQPIPYLSGRVVDKADMLSSQDEATIAQTLESFENTKGSQIVVLTVLTTAPEAIEQFSMRVVESWKLGRKDVNDGVLLLIAKEDRAFRIEVGYGLEGVLPDAVARRILDEILKPYLQRGDAAGGVKAAVDSLVKVISGEPLPPPSSPPFTEDIFHTIMVVVIIGLFIASGLTQVGKMSEVGGAATSAVLCMAVATLAVSGFVGVVAAFFIFLLGAAGGTSLGYRSGGGRGGWSSGGGGGGFSGGGGSFGGGGASGRW